MFSRAALTTLTLLCCVLLVATPVTAALGATTVGQTAGTTTPAQTAEPGAESDAQNVCFPDDGYAFSIGTEGPQIDVVIHLSLLTNLGGPGTLGVELAGTTGQQPIVELRTGVVFNGIDDLGAFLNDPFSAFSIAYEYAFRLPMFGDGFAYDDTEVPIDGLVDDADCRL